MLNYFSFKKLFLCHIIFFIIFTSLSYYCVKFVYGADSGASFTYLEDIAGHYFHSLANQNYQEKYTTSGSYFFPYPSSYGTGYPFGTGPYKGFPDMSYGSSVIPYGGSYGIEGADLFTDSTLGLFGGYGLYNGLGSYGFKDSYLYGGFGGLYGFENSYLYGGFGGLYGLVDSYPYGGFGGLSSVGDASDVTPVEKLIKPQTSTPSSSIPSGEDTSIVDPNGPSVPISLFTELPPPNPLKIKPPILATPLMIEPPALPLQVLSTIPLAIPLPGVTTALLLGGGGGISITTLLLLGLVPDISIINIDLPCMGIYVPSDPFNFATVSSFFPGGIYTGPVTTIEGNVITIITPVVCPLYTAPIGVVDLNSINYIPINPSNNLIIPSPFVTIYGPNGELLSGTRETATIRWFPWF